MRRIMPRHASFWLSVFAGMLALAVTFWWLPEYAVGLSGSVMFIAFLVLTSLRVPLLSPDYLREHAAEEDAPAHGIFIIVTVVVVACLMSLFLAINRAGPTDPWLVAVSVSSVFLGWFTVQTLGALHYAYEYYQTHGDGSNIGCGLDFPGDVEPGGYDFIYFSFAVGTSVATSDVKVVGQYMRRLVTLHMVFAHFFNTIILAAAVNILFSLGSG